jgi:hypothetical protein
MPVIGWLHPASGVGGYFDGFRQGLADRGFVEGRNVTIEHRWAEGHNERLPVLAAELVARQVNVMIVGSNASALAAKAATSTIPIVFSMGGDPVRLGLVASFNRPGGNLTGINIESDVLIKKRLELMHERVPSASNIAVLLNPSNPDNETRMRDVQAAAQAMGQQIHVLLASTPGEIDNAFATLAEHSSACLSFSWRTHPPTRPPLWNRYVLFSRPRTPRPREQTLRCAREAWKNGREEGKVSLRRLQRRSAEYSVAMQIWLGKQYLGQSDKQAQSGPDGCPIKQTVQYIVTRVPRQ